MCMCILHICLQISSCATFKVKQVKFKCLNPAFSFDKKLKAQVKVWMFLLVVISCIKLFVNFQRSTSDFQFKEQQSIHEQTNLDGMWQIKGSAEVVFCFDIYININRASCLYLYKNTIIKLKSVQWCEVSI